MAEEFKANNAYELVETYNEQNEPQDKVDQLIAQIKQLAMQGEMFFYVNEELDKFVLDELERKLFNVKRFLGEDDNVQYRISWMENEIREPDQEVDEHPRGNIG